MAVRLETVKNLYKNSGESIPPLLIICTWLISSFLLYPHQSAKNPTQKKSINKLTTVKKITNKVAVRKNNNNNNKSLSYVIQTLTPTIPPVSVTPHQIINSNNSYMPNTIPTQVPVPTALISNNQNVKQPAPTQENSPDNTNQSDNQANQSANNQNHANNTLGGVSKIVNNVVPSTVSLLNTNPLTSTKNQ